MNQILFYFFIGLSLSMDAFSFSLVTGANLKFRKNIIMLSFIVGLFHFLMPYLGSIIGNYYLLRYIHDANIIIGIVFIIIAIQMFFSIKKEEKKQYSYTKLIFILMPLTVSLDSFSVGIALSLREENIIAAGIIFSVISFIMTFFGLKIGNKIHENYEKKSYLFGGLILLLLGIYHIFH